MSDYVVRLWDRHGAATHARVLAHGVGWIRVDLTGATMVLREGPRTPDGLGSEATAPTALGPWPLWTTSLVCVRDVVPNYASRAPAAKPRRRSAK